MHFVSLTLEDFQSHEKSTFKLDKGLNVLVGLSNSGKSSVSRALQFILMGSPWDKSWVRFGSKYCKIILETSTGVVVERHKGDKINKYILILPNQEPQHFDSFGTNVPEVIQQALNIHEVPINNTESVNLNVALQHDSLFLLSSVPSVRARILGKLSGADILDSAIQSINKDKRQITTEKGSKELELTELQAQVDKLTPIEAFSERIVVLEQRLTSLTIAEQRVEHIKELFRRVKQLKAAWERETEIEALLSNIDISFIDQLAQRVDKIKSLSSFLNRFINLRDSLEKQSRLQNLLTPIDISAIVTLTEKISSLKRVKDLSVKIDKNKQEYVLKQINCEQTEKQYKEAKEQYSKLLKNAGMCPTCNQSTLNI